MNKPSAFRAAFSDLKIIKTRQCVQLIFELPLSDFDHAYEVLGGLPDSSKEQWFGIAAISADAAQPGQVESKRTARAWADLPPSQQAGIRCEEPSFQTFLKEERPDDWHESNWDAAECVRLICCIESRADLTTNNKARVIWKQLDDQYQAWKALEHA